MRVNKESVTARLSAVLCSAALGACAQPVDLSAKASPSPPVPVCEARPTPVAAPVPPLICPPARSASSAEPADAAARNLLVYYERVRPMPISELTKELARFGDVSGNPAATLELAVVLGQTRNTADTVRAIALLEPLARSTAPELAPWQPLARLLASRFSEQRRVEEQMERQNQQLRDNQRRIDQLNEKLEALKAIERSLTTRPPPPASVPAPPPPVPAPAPPPANR